MSRMQKINKNEKARFRELVASAETAFEEKRYQDAYNLYEDAILVNPFDETVSEKMESLKPFIQALMYVWRNGRR